MRVDGNAATVIPHRQPAVGGEHDVDRGGMTGDRLVHRIVDDLGGEVMVGRLVSAADIHAGTPADGFEALEYLDVLGGIVLAGIAVAGAGLGRLGRRDGLASYGRTGGREEVVHAVFRCQAAT